MIEMGNLNSISGKPTGSGYALSYTSGQTGNGLYSGTNYKVRAGFQYISSIIPFRFSIDKTFIDFGTVTPGSFIQRTNLLTISNGSAFGYQVTVSQNHNLRVNATGQEIPATVCNSGSPCTTSTAGIWNDPLTYGFGYNCQNVSGTDCVPGFTDATYYKPFIASPSAVAVMSGLVVGTNKQVTISYQLNVSGSQAPGLYTNIINYIATPTF